MENNSGIDASWIKSEADFVELLAADPLGDAVELDYWQRQYIRDNRRSLGVNKSRQVGFSYIEACKALARSHLRPDYRKYFVSINLDESKNKIRYVRQLYSSLPEQWRLKIVTDAKTEIAFEDSKGRVSLIKALTSREPRGMNGDICLDEFAHYKSARKILDAAGAVGIRGGWQLSVGSSPLSQDGPFWEIITNYQSKFSHFGTYSIPWWLSRALCRDVKRAAKEAQGMPLEQRVAEFGSEPLREAFSYYTRESFIQEFECGFVDEASAFMPYDLIRSCWEESYGEDSKDSEVKFLCGIREDEPTSGFWEWVKKSCSGMVEIGFDVGRKKDLSVLVVTDEVNGRKDVRAIVTLAQKKFAIQEMILSDAISICRPQACRIDNTGIGMPLAEAMQSRFNSVVEPVTFTNLSKAVMANNIKARFEKGGIRIPAWQTLVSHIHSIKREVTASNNFTYEADSSEHHGDIFWALGLTDYRDISASHAPILPTSQFEAYEALKNANSRFNNFSRRY